MVAAWTSYAYIPFIAPLIGFAMFGFGLCVYFSVFANHRILDYKLIGWLKLYYLGGNLELCGGRIWTLFRQCAWSCCFRPESRESLYHSYNTQSNGRIGRSHLSTLYVP